MSNDHDLSRRFAAAMFEAEILIRERRRLVDVGRTHLAWHGILRVRLGPLVDTTILAYQRFRALRSRRLIAHSEHYSVDDPDCRGCTTILNLVPCHVTCGRLHTMLNFDSDPFGTEQKANMPTVFGHYLGVLCDFTKRFNGPDHGAPSHPFE